MNKPKHVHLLQQEDLRWFNVTKNSAEEINYLKSNFSFHSLDLQDCLPPNQRPKLVERQEYIFMILLFPVYNRKTKEIKPVEIDLFISHNLLVTVHDNQLAPIRELFSHCQKNKAFREEIFSQGVSSILYEILNRLLNYCFPMLVHINNDIEEAENKIFNRQGHGMIIEISNIKRNIVNFRRAMQAHKNVIKKLVEATSRFFVNVKLNVYYSNLIDVSKEIWDLLENNRETINALHETQQSLSSYRLNQVIKALTIISVVMLPVHLVAFIFSMDAIYTPIVGSPYDFWIILGIMIVVAGSLLTAFRKKGWW
ncbi:MAG: magnesium transporter CorA family protein [Patescibacteria group bacterium]